MCESGIVSISLLALPLDSTCGWFCGVFKACGISNIHIEMLFMRYGPWPLSCRLREMSPAKGQDRGEGRLRHSDPHKSQGAQGGSDLLACLAWIECHSHVCPADVFGCVRACTSVCLRPPPRFECVWLEYEQESNVCHTLL